MYNTLYIFPEKLYIYLLAVGLVVCTYVCMYVCMYVRYLQTFIKGTLYVLHNIDTMILCSFLKWCFKYPCF